MVLIGLQLLASWALAVSASPSTTASTEAFPNVPVRTSAAKASRIKAQIPQDASGRKQASAFERRLKYLNDRYAGFLKYMQEKQERDKDRQQADEAQRELRRAREKEREQAREEYVASRRSQKELQKRKQSRQEWLQEQIKFHQQQETERQEYVARRKVLERIEKQAKKIPEDVEVGLKPYHP